jgi:hypothetical protein
VIKENILFPYMHGLTFISYLFGHGGWEKINDAYIKTPVSTEQIVHPEKYIIGEMPVPVEISESLNNVKGYKLVEKNTLGEFNINLMLKKHLTSQIASKASTGWGGDTFLILENKERNDFILIWKTVWDSEEDAVDFLDVYKLYTKRKYHKITEKNTGRTDDFIFTKDNRFVFIRIRGKEVIILELPEEELIETLLEELVKKSSSV